MLLRSYSFPIIPEIVTGYLSKENMSAFVKKVGLDDKIFSFYRIKLACAFAGYDNPKTPQFFTRQEDRFEMIEKYLNKLNEVICEANEHYPDMNQDNAESIFAKEEVFFNLPVLICAIFCQKLYLFISDISDLFIRKALTEKLDCKVTQMMRQVLAVYGFVNFHYCGNKTPSLPSRLPIMAVMAAKLIYTIVGFEPSSIAFETDVANKQDAMEFLFLLARMGCYNAFSDFSNVLINDMRFARDTIVVSKQALKNDGLAIFSLSSIWLERMSKELMPSYGIGAQLNLLVICSNFMLLLQTQFYALGQIWNKPNLQKQERQALFDGIRTTGRLISLIGERVLQGLDLLSAVILAGPSGPAEEEIIFAFEEIKLFKKELFYHLRTLHGFQYKNAPLGKEAWSSLFNNAKAKVHAEISEMTISFSMILAGAERISNADENESSNTIILGRN